MTILCQKEWQLVQEGKIYFPQKTEEILYPQPFLAEAVLEKQDWYFEFQPKLVTEHYIILFTSW